MAKFKSKSGLPEALGSTAHLQPPSGFKPKPMCDIPGCRTRRTGKTTLPNGREEYLYAQGFGEVVIRTNDGREHGYVCQACYMRILDQAGKDQLSCAARSEERIAQPDLNAPASRPSGLIDHLSAIERNVLQRADALANHDRWERDKAEFQAQQAAEDAIADRWSAEHDHVE